MGNTEETSMLLFRIIKKLRSEEKSDTVLILDADGLNVFQGKAELLGNMGIKVIITPHFGEMARLTGKTIEYIKKNRINALLNLLKRTS